MMSSRTKTIVKGLVLLLVAAGFSYWGYAAYKKRELRAAVAAILQDVGPRMRDALTLEVSLPPVGRLGTGPQLEQQAATVDQRLQQLKRMDGKPDFGLYDAADSYVLTVREILRRQAASNRYRESLSESLDALRKHMQSDDRTGAWVTEAVIAKERADKDYREYRIATEAFVTVLATLPAAQAKIVPHVDAAQLVEQQLMDETRKRTLEASAQAAAEIEKLKQLEGYR
jgi:hypothetical protein